MFEYANNTIIDFVDSLLKSAINYSASDIHIEQTNDNARVRFRIDGILYDQNPIEKNKKDRVIARLKVIASISIVQKRVPQDGKFRFNHNDNFIDLRVSTFPTIYGEKVVIRILDRSKTMISIGKLGFSSAMLQKIKQLITHSSGFFLVTGPTGSGKTTTLYSILAHLNSSEKNIITLEDPVEYNVDGITQAQMHSDAGFTFEKAVRSLLRQDPDVAMIGEIRDKQTAQIAIQSALTGHLVFSTLHTNDAPSVIMRLMDMGIEPFLINASLTGVLAQRLVRVLCSKCKVSLVPDELDKILIKKYQLNVADLKTSSGCTGCFHLGYKGRIGVFELLIMTPALRSLIVEGANLDKIVEQAKKDGMQTLFDDGLEKVKNGIISLKEFAKIIL